MTNECMNGLLTHMTALHFVHYYLSMDFSMFAVWTLPCGLISNTWCAGSINLMWFCHWRAAAQILHNITQLVGFHAMPKHNEIGIHMLKIEYNFKWKHKQLPYGDCIINCCWDWIVEMHMGRPNEQTNHCYTSSIRIIDNYIRHRTRYRYKYWHFEWFNLYARRYAYVSQKKREE